MSVAANDVHRRFLKAYHALLAHPELHQLMRADRREELIAHAQVLLPLMQADTAPDAADGSAIAEAHAETRTTLGRLHDGVRYVYAKYPSLLNDLGPLTLGDSPAEDRVRLTLLLKKLPEVVEPKFVWLKDLTLHHASEILKRHADADVRQAALDKQTKAQRQQAARLRELRPVTQGIWTRWLASWIETNIDDREEQVTVWGLERKHKGRPAAKDEKKDEKAAPKKRSKKKDAADQKAGQGDDKAGANTPPAQTAAAPAKTGTDGKA